MNRICQFVEGGLTLDPYTGTGDRVITTAYFENTKIEGLWTGDTWEDIFLTFPEGPVTLDELPTEADIFTKLNESRWSL